MPDIAAELVSQFIDFLRSFKNSESLSPELRKKISVRTNLHKMLIDVCGGGRTVLLTGSAGSGKTHLLHSIVSEIAPLGRVLNEPDNLQEKFVLVVEDATELTPADRIKFALTKDPRCLCKLMAINEGPLREAARAKGGEYFGAAIALLHDGQRGISKKYDPQKPVVIDMRAYDPLEEGLIEHLLGLDLLQEAIETECPDEDSPRRRAWEMLSHPEVRARVAAVARLAKLAQPEWLFRDVWDFVADLALGGSDDEEIPSSPWFWRLFFGDNLISRAIRSIADPMLHALPFVESRIWYGDWMSDQIRLLDGITIMPIAKPETDEAFIWAKLQCLLLASNYRFDEAALGSADERLVAAVAGANTGALIKQINEYVTFGLADSNETSLDLWVDHRLERRAQSHTGLIKLGSAPASEFSIRKSLVALNHPNKEAAALPGSHSFLVHDSTNSVFSLDSRRLAILERSRSTRIADRDQVDFQWDLYRFFDSILGKKASDNVFEIYQADIERSRCNLHRYAVSRRPPLLEAKA